MAEKCKCNVLGLGFALGIVCALYVFLLGISAYFGWGNKLVELISNWYIGYSAGFLGSIIGAIWAFIDGFVIGIIIAWIYNKF